MTLYQKIPTQTSRVHPLMVIGALGVILLSLISTAAIIGWLPAHEGPPVAAAGALAPAAGYATVSAPGPANAAQAPSPTKARAQRNKSVQAPMAQLAKA